MNAKTIVGREFLLPFAKPGRENIGVELEFPLVNMDRGPVDVAVARGLLEECMQKHGFWAEEFDQEGNAAFLLNPDGDCLSFDNSYNNFEFSMEKGKDLNELARRFYALYEKVQTYLLPRRHTLCGMGTNPFQPIIRPAAVSFPVYQLIHTFLEPYRGGAYHNWPEFPAYLSSVQTHLDVSEDLLPRALTLFAAMDFVRALLFSNSPAFFGLSGFEETVCFRDYLWENSGFKRLANNVGKVEGTFREPEDVVQMILSRSMFYRQRAGQLQLIEPVSVQQYFDGEDSTEEDMKTYLSFQNVEVTRRGTLEVRSDCAQPVADAFCPPAFHLGVLSALEEAEELLYGFLRRNLPEDLLCSPSRNRILRDEVIYHYRLPAPEEEIRRLLRSFVELANRSLTKRGKKEEKLIEPLFERAQRITCPAKERMELLEAGVPLEKLIAESAKAKK